MIKPGDTVYYYNRYYKTLCSAIFDREDSVNPGNLIIVNPAPIDDDVFIRRGAFSIRKERITESLEAAKKKHLIENLMNRERDD